MRATVIVDNKRNGMILGEWGLCIYIEYEDKKILLDAGASNLFLENAKKLGIALQEVDFAVLSHGHYDHANGMKGFFEINDHAPFYLQETCSDFCYYKRLFVKKYLGIPKGILQEFPERIILASGNYEICPGVRLIAHTTAGLQQVGRREHMYQRVNGSWKPDDFSHEQSLVFETERGLVIFNSCSHGGAANIIREVSEVYPNTPILALIGGFHIYNKPEKEVRKLAQNIKETGIEAIYTGHCTGEAFTILKEELGERAHSFSVGLQMEF